MSIAPVPGVPPSGPTSYGAQSWAGRRQAPDAGVDALGLDPAELDRQLRAGATIAEVAAAKGVTPAKVVEAISTLMAPNADLNGDVPARLSLHRTEPVPPRRPVPRHEAHNAPAPRDPAHPAARDRRPTTPSPLTPPPPLSPPGLPPTAQTPYAPPDDPGTLNTYA
jgi:hypothetical protein